MRNLHANEMRVLVNGQLTKHTNLPKLEPDRLNVYEVVRAQDGVILFAEDHYKRLCNSLSIAQCQLDLDFKQWLTQLTTVLHANKTSNINIRFDAYFADVGHIVTFISPVVPHYPTPFERQNGIVTELQHDERTNPNAKITLHELRSTAISLIDKKNAYETLLVDKHNQITEGSRSNFFAIKNNILYTAPMQMVLPGIIRNKVLEIASKLGIETILAPTLASDIANLDAAFITGTSPRILTINRIGNVGLKVSHPIIDQLYSGLETEISAYISDHPKQ